MKKLLELIKGQARTYWRSMSLALVLSFVVMVLGVVSVSLFATIIKVVLTEINPDMAAATAETAVMPGSLDISSWIGYLAAVSAGFIQRLGPFRFVAYLCLAHLVITVVSKGLEMLSAQMLWRVRCRAGAQMMDNMFGHISALSMDFFDRNQVGELAVRVTNDTYQLATCIFNIISTFLKATPMVLVYTVILFQTSMSLTSVVLVVALVTLAVTHELARRMRRAIVGANTAMGQIGATMQETFSGIEVVKAYGAECHEQERFNVSNRRNLKHAVRMGILKRLRQPIQGIVQAVAQMTVVVTCMKLITAGQLSPEVCLTYLYVLNRTQKTLNEMAQMGTEVHAALGHASRVFGLMAEKSTVQEGSRSVEGIQDGLELRNVTFAYGDGEDVIHDVDLTVKRGDVVAIVGPSGAGKSSLVKLLLRFYDPQNGSVLLDGVDIREMKQAAYRRLFGVVTQQTVLFHTSVGENIRYGRGSEAVDDESIRRAGQIANADGFITEWPDGYETIVGDRGMRLSGGQRQRIAIARAVLRDPSILILDEATSSLDSESERMVQDAIEHLLSGRTAIVIAHRLSTILKADKIIVMDKGRIVEQGSHGELLSGDGLYKQLYDLQFSVQESPDE